MFFAFIYCCRIQAQTCMNNGPVVTWFDEKVFNDVVYDLLAADGSLVDAGLLTSSLWNLLLYRFDH